MGWNQRVVVGFGLPLPKNKLQKNAPGKIFQIDTNKYNHVKKAVIVRNKPIILPLNDGIVLFNKILSIQTTGMFIGNGIHGPFEGNKIYENYDMYVYGGMDNKFYKFLNKLQIRMDDQIESQNINCKFPSYQIWLHERINEKQQIKDILGYYLVGL